jgi:RNA polymerase sigma factor (sigma-70 family)
MNKKLSPIQAMLRDLPLPLQRAVCEVVAECCHRAPPLYRGDGLMDLYQEAALAACYALQRYNPDKGSLHEWGCLCIRQHLTKIFAKLAAVSKYEVAWPVDEETGEPIEFEDEGAQEQFEQHVLEAQVREALCQLEPKARQLIEWHYGDGLSERQIAHRLGCSQQAVHKRLKASVRRLRRIVGTAHLSP